MADTESPIGKVTATESKPTSCSTVRFWVRDDVIIRPFDIVRIPHLKGSHTYAIITDLEYLTDSAGDLANYVSSDFGEVGAMPLNPRLGTTVAEAEVLMNDKEIEDLRYNCLAGNIMCGECKLTLAERVEKFLIQHQEKREKAKDRFEEYLFNPKDSW